MRALSWLSFAAVLLSGLTVAQLVVDNGRTTEDVGQLSGNATAGDHTNNWAVLVCASRFWFNYRVCRRSNYLLDTADASAYGQHSGHVRLYEIHLT